MRIALLFVFLLILNVSIYAQDERINNGAWQVVESDKLQMRLPQAWQLSDNYPSIWLSPDESIRLNLSTEITRTGLEEAIEALALTELTIIQDTFLSLPVGEAYHYEYQLADSYTIEYLFILNNNEARLTLSSMVELNQSELQDFQALARQIANTINSIERNPDAWILHADTNAQVFLQTPRNWLKQNSPSQSLIIQESFDEVFINVNYRDLGQEIPLENLESSFVQAFENASYSITEQSFINIPLGDALLFHLEDVNLGESVHQQLQVVVMRGELLIVIALSAKANYFADYEAQLYQILDTIYLEDSANRA